MSALTISRERSGENRQSEVNDATRKRACGGRERGGQVAAVRVRRIEVIERGASIRR